MNEKEHQWHLRKMVSHITKLPKTDFSEHWRQWSEELLNKLRGSDKYA